MVKYPYVEPELTAEAHRHPKMAAAKAEGLQRATRAKVAAVVHGEDYIRHVFDATVLHYDSHSVYVNDQILDVFQLASCLCTVRPVKHCVVVASAEQRGSPHLVPLELNRPLCQNV